MGLSAVSLIDHLPQNGGETVVIFVAEGNESERLQLAGDRVTGRSSSTSPLMGPDFDRI